jgi:hypothetical protein
MKVLDDELKAFHESAHACANFYFGWRSGESDSQWRQRFNTMSGPLAALS